jgi:GAF domain-containing protein
VPGDEREADPGILRRLDEATRALADLGFVLDREEDIGRALQRSVSQVARAVPGADMASVSVLRGDTAETVASTSERVWAIDADQYAAGDGPCLEAARSGQVVRVGLAEARERWPAFAASARTAGIRSYLSAPLMVDEKFAGSLNLYSEQPGGFGDLDESLLQLYSTAATAVIANARRYAEARELAGNLRRAIESRSVIDQAIGALMATRGLDADAAFQVLSRESQDTNTKLRDLAAQVLKTARQRGSGRGAQRLRAAPARAGRTGATRRRAGTAVPARRGHLAGLRLSGPDREAINTDC